MTGGAEGRPAAGELQSVVREEFGRVAYSFKTHQKIIDRYNGRIHRLKVWNALLLTATAGGTVDVLVRDQTASKIVTLLLSALALGLAIYSLSVNLDRLVDQHRVAARSLWLLREEYIHLVGDLKSGAVGDAEGRRLRDELTRRAARVYETAPDTDAKAYAEAQRALKENEELTFSPREIDLLLPAGLREGEPGRG